MARIPEIVRSNPISQVAATTEAPAAGAGWAALAGLAKAGADFVKPAAKKQAVEEGLNSVYRDADGTLKVKEKSVLGGEMADLHNSAAFAKYTAQRQIDMAETFTELGRKYEFDPAGFKEASDAYLKIMGEDESVPKALREDLMLTAQTEANRRFNGLYDQEIDRTYREADRNTLALRDMMADDYINLVLGGDMAAAEAKMAEIEGLSAFRTNAPYISETEAETSAYLRGIRGSAKAAQLMQTLSGLAGATEISDDLRGQIMETLKDPDISPDARMKLYEATNGRLKGIDAAGIVSGLTDGSYAAKVTRAESGGAADATNPNSSATGIHGFISGTWMENVRELQKQGGAQWANGMSNDDILDMRKNPTASNEVFAHFTAKNQRALADAGLPVNDATTYMAHFFGVGGAITVLKADPTALISDLLPGVVESNPFMSNMTVSDASNWAARKMTVKTSDIAAQQVRIDQIEDPELRAMASDILRDRLMVRKNIEDASATEYEARVAGRDPTLTEGEVLRDHSLGDQSQQTIVAAIRKANEESTTTAQTIATIVNPTAKMDFSDAKTRSNTDKAYNAVLGDEPAMSATGMRAAGEIAASRGYLPKPSFEAIRQSVNGGDPAALAQSMEFLNQVVGNQPTALMFHDGKGDVQDALADYTFYSGFMSGEEAAARMIEDRLPENVAKRKNLSDAAKEGAKGLAPKDIVDHLSGKGVTAELGNTGQQAEMMSEYERLYTDAFVKTGDDGRARERALSELSRVYGPDGATGSNRLMKFPPQNFYPTPVGIDPSWMQDQLIADVSDFAFGADRVSIPQDWPLIKSTVVEIKEVAPEKIQLTSDARTRQDVASGKPPSYKVGYFDEDGTYEEMPQRFVFDPTNVISDSFLIGKANRQRANALLDRQNALNWALQTNAQGLPWNPSGPHGGN